ncbi:tetratricopeptide repeat protein [Vibrio bivalvicida]|uniref:MSHA biogenesis protein MshN n=1 Tax=Vibrio bivalvicida TaxID=1276888 RepID=A0A177Y1C4_9VIBR|nr:tetratricopeptide repeat protein [Vibrio bivalvicida]OAJ94674.1 MSHA biogenesis protein MshN [Vibrio bivalvicida]
MSAINDALSRLANSKSNLGANIHKAEVQPVKKMAVLPWVVGSFTLSLAVGGWALSQQSPTEGIVLSVAPISSPVAIASPTAKLSVVDQPVYQSITEENVATHPVSKAVSPAPSQQKVVPKPVLTAKVETSTSRSSSTAVANQGEVVIEQVELTSEQLSAKAQERAKKALDSNNLTDALNHYVESLRFTPANKQVRKRLAALYYGKGEVRKAAEILQKGIALDRNDSTLRLSLAKMLMKEQQNAVALTVLSTLPASVSVEYLSLRAALAQKEKHDELALQSYQQLVQREPDSGRWWMGLGIQQERAFQLADAKSSYSQALTKLGLSSQSQQFIRDRVSLIESLEEQPSED